VTGYWFSDNKISIFGGNGFQSYAWVVDFVGDCGVGIRFRTTLYSIMVPHINLKLKEDGYDRKCRMR